MRLGRGACLSALGRHAEFVGGNRCRCHPATRLFCGADRQRAPATADLQEVICGAELQLAIYRIQLVQRGLL